MPLCSYSRKLRFRMYLKLKQKYLTQKKYFDKSEMINSKIMKN